MSEAAPKPLYGYTWQKARLGYLRKHPLCVEHLKRDAYVNAVIVDHIIPHRGDLVLFWDKSNWQSLCKLCHDSHKQRLERSGKVVGCTVDGVPLDPTHHWMSKK